MDINLFSIPMSVYKGDDLVKEFLCPKFYMIDYIAQFVYENSPYKVVTTLPDGTKHTFSIETVTSLQST